MHLRPVFAVILLVLRAPSWGACPSASTSLSAIESLAIDAERLSKEIAQADNRLLELSNQLSNLMIEKDRALAEYREGLFCSGCGKTRSEILATGQQFPHPGQTVVKATQKQLDDKAREFDQKIAGVERELDALARIQADRRARHSDLVGNQLPSHVLAWRDAMNCKATEEDEKWEQAATLADKTIQQLMKTVTGATDPTRVRLLKGRLRELANKREELNTEHQLRSAEFENTKSDGLARIGNALSRAGAPFLVPVLSSMAGMQPISLSFPGVDVSLGFDRLSVSMSVGDYAAVKLSAEGNFLKGTTSIAGTLEGLGTSVGIQRTTLPGGAQVDQAIYPQLPAVPWPKPIELEATGNAPR